MRILAPMVPFFTSVPLLPVAHNAPLALILILPFVLHTGFPELSVTLRPLARWWPPCASHGALGRMGVPHRSVKSLNAAVLGRVRTPVAE